MVIVSVDSILRIQGDSSIHITTCIGGIMSQAVDLGTISIVLVNIFVLWPSANIKIFVTTFLFFLFQRFC